MTFSLSKASITELQGVHPDLIQCVKRAIRISKQDFVVNDGRRTLTEQREFVKKGFSKTMKSRHLVQKDGLGYAVDLVPFINKKVRWEWAGIWPIASAMSQAATELGVELTWGSVWDRRMSAYGSSVAALKAAVEAYKVRHKGSDFLDGPHYQYEGRTAQRIQDEKDNKFILDD